MTVHNHFEAPQSGASSVKEELIAGVHFFILADIFIFAALLFCISDLGGA